MVACCLDQEKHATAALNEIDCPAWRNPHAITVVIPRPSPSVIRKWRIAVNGDNGHIITMPQVTTERIDEFVADMQKDCMSTSC